MTRKRRVQVGILRFLGTLISLSVLAVDIVVRGIGVRLAAEKQALLRDGCPVEPQLLQRPLPPANQNAAPTYARLLAIFNKQPFTPAEDLLFYKTTSRGRKLSAEGRSTARAALARNADLLPLIHYVATRPECVFLRNWNQRANMVFPEYELMRELVRILAVESYLLASDGRFSQAVATQTLGFKVAEHAGSDPILIGYLVDIACDAIALQGMQHILSLSQGRPDVDEAVYQAIAIHHPRIDLHEAMKGEVALAISIDRDMRKASAGANNPVSDALLVEALHYDRQALEASRLSGRQLVEAMGQLERDLVRRHSGIGRFDPFLALADVMVPVYHQAASRQLVDQARQAAVQAEAKVLEYRANHRSLPASLDRIDPPVPVDPWSGQPLHYRPEGDGFIIYSVGPTGHYNGGKPGAGTFYNETAVTYP